MANRPETPQQLAERVLSECGGDEALARFALARLLLAARRGMTPGYLRLGAVGRSGKMGVPGNQGA